jgi:DNA-binding NarL/FixJ family response regulator
MTRPVRVLIVDDDALVRSGLTMMLGGADSVEVVGEAQDGSEVLGAIDRHRPDVLMLDLRMPNVDGLGALALLRGQPQPPAVIVLTTFDTDEHVLQALRQGAAGFLVKDTPPAEIVRAIELVASGESMLSPTVTRRLIDHLAADSAGDERRRAADRLRRLSPRDVEIADAIAQGKGERRDRGRASPERRHDQEPRVGDAGHAAAREPGAAGPPRPGRAPRLSGLGGAAG